MKRLFLLVSIIHGGMQASDSGDAPDVVLVSSQDADSCLHILTYAASIVTKSLKNISFGRWVSLAGEDKESDDEEEQEKRVSPELGNAQMPVAFPQGALEVDKAKVRRTHSQADGRVVAASSSSEEGDVSSTGGSSLCHKNHLSIENDKKDA